MTTKQIELSFEDRDILYKLLEESKPIPTKMMGEVFMNIADTAKYHELNTLEQKLKSSDRRYEPVSRKEYEKRGGK